jgi:hypothetical protein
MSDRWKEIDRYLESRGIRVEPPTLNLTTGGHHANGPGHQSLHYLGLARDYDSNAATIARSLEFIASNSHGPIAELFYAPLGIWYKNGQQLDSGALRVGGHQTHCHVALKQFGQLF